MTLHTLIEWIRAHRWLALALAGLALLVMGYAALRRARGVREEAAPPSDGFAMWRTADPDEQQSMMTIRAGVACPGAPFILPADGWIGLLYGDPRGPYTQARRHQGIDIFSPGPAGTTPVLAAYDGYVTRQPEWKSALIMRVPDDPLEPGRQIWLYYTHMADETGEIDFIDAAFPPGTREVFVEQGTLLGHTGNYSGDPLRGVWVHLHFSIVLDDGQGGYRNELEFNNTVDPSRYLGLPVNVACAPLVPTCDPNPLCEEAVLSAAGG
jgi:murein DD-endopeptidase MepM/ murein hydrolase activator NlpD